MMDIKERKKIIFDTIQLERERDELGNEILKKEKQMKKLTIDLEYAENEYSKLESSGLQKFFLGLTGKRDARLQEAQNELRKARSEMASVEFEITSAKNRIEMITEELKEIEDYVRECILALGEVDGGVQMRDTITVLREIPSVCDKIDDKITELKSLLKKADDIFTYGDIQTSLSGGRYNRRDTTLREHTYKIKAVVNTLIQLIEDYNSIIPEELHIEFREEWMDNTEYWDCQHLAEDSYERVKKVDDWFFRFSSLWKQMQKQQDEVIEQLRNVALDYLV